MTAIHIDRTVEELQAAIDAKKADAERWLNTFQTDLINTGDQYRGRGYPAVVDEFLEERGFNPPPRPKLHIVPTTVTATLTMKTEVMAMNAAEAAQKVRDGDQGNVNLAGEMAARLNYPRDYNEDQRPTFTHEVNEEEVHVKPARRR